MDKNWNNCTGTFFKNAAAERFFRTVIFKRLIIVNSIYLITYKGVFTCPSDNWGSSGCSPLVWVSEQLPGSDRVNHTHMVYQEVWSNAAVGQQERRAWWGQNRRERTAGRTVIPTPAPGLLIQPPNSKTISGFWSHDADGRSRRCVKFSFIPNRRTGRSQLCVCFTVD